MLKSIVGAVRLFLVSLLTLTSGLMFVTDARQGEIAHFGEGCNASFAVISDIHMKNNAIRQSVFELGLADMEAAVDRLDAVVFNGDTTEQGEIAMWQRIADSVAAYDFTDNLIIVEGNHDSRGPVPGDLEATKQHFIKVNKEISGRDITEVYYSTTIGGYPAIILGSEGNSTYADVSQAQIDWFAAEMGKASQTGKPIFVFFHQSINGTHGLPYTWDMKETDDPAKGGIGKASDDIFNIIKQYNNVFYISGHIHTGFTKEDNEYIQSVEKHDGYTLINLPSYMYMDVKRGDHIPCGTGYVVEIYDNQVLLRARNFTTGTWCRAYDVAIDLTPSTAG